MISSTGLAAVHPAESGKPPSPRGKRRSPRPSARKLLHAMCCADCEPLLRDAAAALTHERRLIERLLEESESFKRALAAEICEGFNQMLVGALLHLQTVERLQRKDPDEAQALLRTGLELLRDTLDEARRIARRLRPPVLDDYDVVEGIRHLIDETRRYGGPRVEFLQHGRLEGLGPSLRIAAFRIIQELLNNACNHSGSAQVRVIVNCDGRRLRIEVEDWGVGFDPARVGDEYFGLRKIRERARLLGGRASVSSAPGEGTRVVAELPIAQAIS